MDAAAVVDFVKGEAALAGWRGSTKRRDAHIRSLAHVSAITQTLAKCRAGLVCSVLVEAAVAVNATGWGDIS